jgi:hypothetical protein
MGNEYDSFSPQSACKIWNYFCKTQIAERGEHAGKANERQANGLI